MRAGRKMDRKKSAARIFHDIFLAKPLRDAQIQYHMTRDERKTACLRGPGRCLGTPGSMLAGSEGAMLCYHPAL